MKEHTQDVLLGRILGERAAESVPDDLDLWPVIQSEAQILGARRGKRMLYQRAALLTVPLVVLLPLLTLFRLPFEGNSLARRGKRYGVMAFTLGVIILIGVLLLPRPWGGGSLTPDAVFAAAFDDLLTVESFHVVVDGYSSAGSFEISLSRKDLDLGILGIDVAKFGPSEDPLVQIEYDCGEWDGPYRYCTIKTKDSGEVVGSLKEELGSREMHTMGEGDFRGPYTYYYRTTKQYTRAGVTWVWVVGFFEYLAIDGKLYSRSGITMDDLNNSSWEVLSPDVPVQGETQTFFQRLFDQPTQDGISLPSILDEYDSVERLGDVELDGIMTEHYRAERVLDQSGRDVFVVELWLGKEDRIVRKVTKYRGYGPDSSWIWNRTYTFSNFNEPVEIPKPEPGIR